MAMRMQLAEVLPADERTVLWDLTRQLGVQQVVSGIPDGPDLPPAWDFDRLRQIKERSGEAVYKTCSEGVAKWG